MLSWRRMETRYARRSATLSITTPGFRKGLSKFKRFHIRQRTLTKFVTWQVKQVLEGCQNSGVNPGAMVSTMKRRIECQCGSTIDWIAATYAR